MARKYKCPRPVNRLAMMRNKGLSGPMLQNVGGKCVHTTGNAYAPGGPLSGPRAANAYTETETQVVVTFSQCVDRQGDSGSEIQINGGAWIPNTFIAVVSETQLRFTLAAAVNPGDVVRWRYVGGSGSLLDCKKGEDIGDQEIPVNNTLVLAGDFVLLETGGMDIVLLEDDADDTTGLKLENAL